VMLVPMRCGREVRDAADAWGPGGNGCERQASGARMAVARAQGERELGRGRGGRPREKENPFSYL